MKYLNKTKLYGLLFSFLALISMGAAATDMVSYAYDNAGNRISRIVVVLTSTLTHAKKLTEDPSG